MKGGVLSEMISPSKALKEVRILDIVNAGKYASSRGPIAKTFKIRARLKSVDVQNLVVTFETQDFGVQGTQTTYETKFQVNQRLSPDLWKKGQGLYKLKKNIGALRAYFINGFIVNGNANYSCTCKSFLYGGFKFIATKKRSNFEEDQEGRAPKRNNPRELGLGCKHLVGLCQSMETFKEQIVQMAQEALRQMNGAQAAGQHAHKVAKLSVHKAKPSKSWVTINVDLTKFDPNTWTRDLTSSDDNKRILRVQV